MRNKNGPERCLAEKSTKSEEKALRKVDRKGGKGEADFGGKERRNQERKEKTRDEKKNKARQKN